MKITILTDNVTDRENLETEHGFSCFVENGNRKILFDTGQSDIFIRNAEKLGIDLSEADLLIISHGHYDHTDGMAGFLKINQNARILIHPEAFRDKYHNSKYIGINRDIYIPEKRMIRPFRPGAIGNNFYIMDSWDMEKVDEPQFEDFYTVHDGNTVPDLFRDEIYLVELSAPGLNLITGCSHQGIVNILRKAKRTFKIPVNSVCGGFHLKYSGTESAERTGKLLAEENMNKLITGHCTGYENFEMLRDSMLPDLEYGFAGRSFVV